MKSTKHNPETSRALFEKQLKSGDTSNSDLFEKDALDGWSKSGASMELLNPMDKKYKTKFRVSTRWFLLSGLLIIGSILSVFLIQQNKSETIRVATVKKTVFKHDLILSEKVESLQELPASELIEGSKIVSDFKKKASQEENEVISPKLTVDELPLKEIKPSFYSSLQRSKKIGKEIILANLKLVDYRAYRSKPVIKDAQLSLTGTPANQTEIEKITETNPAWENIEIPYHEYIEKSMQQFYTGNYKVCLNRCLQILKSYPDDINALFYSGLCYYNLNDMKEAALSFQAVINNKFSNFDQEAVWYSANTYINSNQKEKAKEILKSIVQENGFYAKQAEEKLKMLK